MHHIQRKILNLLVYAPSLSYAQLRPKGVESNHFAYHLEQLIKAGYIQKLEVGGYGLTAEGLAFADRASHTDMDVRKQPHIVTTVVVTNEQGQTLLFKHGFQPYLNKVGYPQGRIHFSEDITTAATRELAEKAGIKDVKLTHRGMAYIAALRDGQIISKILSHIFTGSVIGRPEVTTASPKGEALWGDLATYTSANTMPGFFEIQKLIQDHKPGQLFFDEIRTELH